MDIVIETRQVLRLTRSNLLDNILIRSIVNKAIKIAAFSEIPSLKLYHLPCHDRLS